MTTSKKFKLDEATKNKMIGLFPVNNDFTVNFTPEEYDDLPKEVRPVFVLKPWSEKECKEMAKEFENESDQDVVLEKVRKQIVGLDNLINMSTESEIEYEEDTTGGLSKTIFSLIPIVIKTSILYRLLTISGIQR